jgi:putative nucleotidyltransferase with HDIG domain
MASIGLTRAQAWALLTTHLTSPNLVKHSLATEAVMRRVARHLGEDEEFWGTTGLLHDLDLDLVGPDMKLHTTKTAQVLRAAGLDETAIDAIVRHNEEQGLPRESRLHHALAACETITGLVTATTLVYPDKDLASVKPKSVAKRMKEKAFAASVRRETILECEAIGVPLATFAELAVEAMRAIAGELGLDGSLVAGS